MSSKANFNVESQVAIISVNVCICSLQKDVIIIVAVILLPIAALIGLTISQVVKSSTIRDDALQAQKDIENFLRVQELVIRIQVYQDQNKSLILPCSDSCQ